MALTKVDDRGLNTPIDLLDNEKIRLGTGNDLELYHDGSHSYIKDTWNDLRIESDSLALRTITGSELYIDCTLNGAVELYHDNSKKLETTGSGIAVSGKLLLGTTTEGLAAGDDLTIATSGETGMTLRSGTSNNGAIYFSDGTSGADEYRGIINYNHTNNYLALYTDASERIRIDSSGKVLVGATSTSATHTLQVQSDGSANAIAVLGRSSDDIGELSFYENDASTKLGELQYRTTEVNFRHRVGGASINFATTPSGGSVTERMRIDSDGTVCIGTNSDHNTGDVISVTGSAHIMEIQNESTAGHRTLTLRHARASGGTDAEQIVFEENGGGAVGSIQSNGSSTSYNTSSDYRLKENVVAISDGITRLKTLKPSRFNFKIDKDTTVDGFLAHEVTAVPEAITGTKDQVATEDDTAYEIGDPIYQSIDQSKLVPLLVAALQEAVAKIETLQTKVAALEAA